MYMVRKSVFSLVISIALLSAGVATTAHAASVKNGVACPKSGAMTTVTVKGVKNTYICRVNPAFASNPNIAKGGKTWTLKTCVTYYAQAQSQQDNINQQLPLIALMSEPDKTTYTKQLNDSQANLMKVIAAIENNYCKTGL
jgi:cytochrome c peroxidase